MRYTCLVVVVVVVVVSMLRFMTGRWLQKRHNSNCHLCFPLALFLFTQFTILGRALRERKKRTFMGLLLNQMSNLSYEDLSRSVNDIIRACRCSVAVAGIMVGEAGVSMG